MEKWLGEEQLGIHRKWVDSPRFKLGSPNIKGDTDGYKLKQEYQAVSTPWADFAWQSLTPRPIGFVPEKIRKILEWLRKSEPPNEMRLSEAFKASEPDRIALVKKLTESRKPLPVILK